MADHILMADNYSIYVDKISENVLKADFENIDKETLENAKNRILDLIGCSIGGADGPGNKAIIDLVKSWGG